VNNESGSDSASVQHWIRNADQAEADSGCGECSAPTGGRHLDVSSADVDPVALRLIAIE
jgi:hypothetical protein